MKKRVLVFAGLAALSFSLTCTEAPSAPLDTAQGALQLLAQAECEMYVRCEPAWQDVAAADCLDAADGVSLWRDEVPHLQDLIDRGQVALDPEAVTACADAMATLACGYATHPTYARWVVPACRRMILGRVPPGGECHDEVNLDLLTPYVTMCEGGHCVTDACPGTCEAYLPRGAECGAYQGWCDWYEDRCDTEGTGTCVARTPEGGACETLETCIRGLECGGPVGEQTCIARRPDGERCWGFEECQSGLCWPESADEPPLEEGGRWTCGGVMAEGEPCMDSRHCAEGTTCALPDDGLPGFCQLSELAEPGATCLTDAGCRPGLVCVDEGGAEKVCRPLSLPGQACEHVCAHTLQPCSGEGDVCASLVGRRTGCTAEGWDHVP